MNEPVLIEVPIPHEITRNCAEFEAQFMIEAAIERIFKQMSGTEEAYKTTERLLTYMMKKYEDPDK